MGDSADITHEFLFGLLNRVFLFSIEEWGVRGSELSIKIKVE